MSDRSIKKSETLASFGERLSLVVKRVGSVAKLERDSGVSAKNIQRYKSGVVEPGLESVVSLARAGGVSLLWLATGEGSIDQSPSPLPPIDESSPSLPSSRAEVAHHVAEITRHVDYFRQREKAGAPIDELRRLQFFVRAATTAAIELGVDEPASRSDLIDRLVQGWAPLPSSAEAKKVSKRRR